MTRLQVIPAVDVLNGQVVRLARGSYDEVTWYGSDPAARVKAWSALGVTLVHVVDLDAARSGRRDVKLLRSLGETGVAFQVSCARWMMTRSSLSVSVYL